MYEGERIKRGVYEVGSVRGGEIQTSNWRVYRGKINTNSTNRSVKY